MGLPRTETTLAAVLLLSAAPFALAAPSGASPPDTPGATAPATAPSTTNPGMSTPSATPPGATTRSGAEQGTEPPGTTSTPGMTPGATSGSATANPNSAAGASTSRYQNRQMRSGTASTGWSHRHMRSAERVPKADIKAAKKAKVSLTDAINTAQQQNHGDVVAARFELRHGKPEYLIRTFDSQSHQEWLGHIDAKTGKVIGQGKMIALDKLPKGAQKELTASSAGTSLAQAVQTAEQQRGGKALAAGLSARNGQVKYRTELLKSNGKTRMAMISPKSGQVSGGYR